MKTLADLKRTCHLYKWKMLHNSWFKNVAPHMAEYRTVASVQSNGLYLNTCRNGERSKSFLEFPKAKELTIKHDGDVIELVIYREFDNGMPPHQMIYRLEQHIY